MPDRSTPLAWTQPGWLDQAGDWIRSELDRQGIAVTGQIAQPHLRPWSTVLRVPTTAGDFYFKATSPMLAHEPALTQWLAHRRPDCIPQVLAVDLERGWMLMPDGGATLRSVLKVDRDVKRWEAVLPIYAQLQIQMAEHLDELLALGCLDYRLAGLPSRYHALLADTYSLRIKLPDGLTSEEYGQLRAFAPRFEALCEQLASYHIPETLHHDDFHDGNIFVRDNGFQFFDWGESCASHPFYTMVVTLRSVAYGFELEQDSAELLRLRDSYLEPWTRYETRVRVLSAFKLAKQVGSFCRALTWHRVVSNLEAPFREEQADAVPGWLQVFLETVLTKTGS